MKKTSRGARHTRKKATRKPADNVSLTARAQQHLCVAIAGLVDIIRTCESDTLRVSAINVLLDRGYGKPPQSLDFAIRDDAPLPQITDDMSVEEAQSIYHQLLKMPSRFRPE